MQSGAKRTNCISNHVLTQVMALRPTHVLLWTTQALYGHFLEGASSKDMYTSPACSVLP